MEEPDAVQRAKAVRSLIASKSSQISVRVRQRDKSLDYGSAIRMLLGLAPGTEKWSLSDRRQAAAKKLKREDVHNLSKTRYKPEYQPSYELELLNELANKLSGREMTPPLPRASPQSTLPVGGGAYDIMYKAWLRATSLLDLLHTLIEDQRKHRNQNPSVQYEPGLETSKLFVSDFYELVQCFENYSFNDHWGDLSFDQVASSRSWMFQDTIDVPISAATVAEWRADSSLPSPNIGTVLGMDTKPVLAWVICKCSPLQSLVLIDAVKESSATIVGLDGMRKDHQELIYSEVMDWLARCRCVDDADCSSNCRAHWLLDACKQWISRLEEQWREMKEAHKSPSSYLPATFHLYRLSLRSKALSN